MNKLQRDTKQLMDDLMVQMSRKGFFFVGVIGYREASSSAECVRVGCSVDVLKHPQMRPQIIRMLQNAATILEAGPETQVREVIELPEP